MSRLASTWSGTEPTSPDPILGLVAAFKADPAKEKVNVAQGACETAGSEPTCKPERPCSLRHIEPPAYDLVPYALG